MTGARAVARGEFSIARRRLVGQLRSSGIRSRRVLEAFAQVPRHRLVPEALREGAYQDVPLPIGEGQTISAPGIVALMSEALELEGSETVLEVGTGSGYQAAILSRLASRVISIERIPSLAAAARRALDDFGVTNVIVHLGDGTTGRRQDAPYDAIVLTAGGPEVPEPLLDQLAPGGRLVGPFGPRGHQELLRIRREAGEGRAFRREVLTLCCFVDLIGEHGWVD